MEGESASGDETRTPPTEEILWTQLVELYATAIDRQFERARVNATADWSELATTGMTDDEPSLSRGLCKLLTRFEPETGLLEVIVGENDPPDVDEPVLSRRHEDVEWYFDEFLEEVALDHPVTRRALSSTLVRVQRHAEERSIIDCSEPTRVVRDTDMEWVAWLPEGSWAAVRTAVDSSSVEMVACQSVHRRVVRTIDRHHHPVDAEPIALLRPRTGSELDSRP